ncbi:hypothetical protein BDV30DRAFT_236028 [Aspergillus minisclerotigenes]|uniref:HNH nuclease domain-containing protein n=1 Tax=Aspergillus minisclerotigenes TaxID=656917 RepID=A0A5N6JE48_9EURO|nr:hypothetical protein BDV30DRAFT_236028 [Aspergillus minisclerotigenes]
MSTLTRTQQTTSLTFSEAQSVTMGPADELIDPQRHELIMELLHLFEEPCIDSVGWACLWFADLSNIRRHITQSKRDKLGCESSKSILTRAVRSKNKGSKDEFDDDLEEPLKDPEEKEMEETPTKKRRHGSSSGQASKLPTLTASSATARPEKGSTSLSPKKSTGRKEAAKKLCKERDKSTCVLTGFREPLEIAHIYPYSLGQRGEKDLKPFWNILYAFWTEERINAWKKEVLGPDGTETCSNLMCMANVAHKLWEKGRFALKPLSLSEDQKVLTVQFYWLPTNSGSKKMPAIETPAPFPGNLSSSTVNGQPSAKLYNIATDAKLCSGHIITFKTDDPVGHPLPSMELLNMQWVLHRVLALSGAADATDEDLESESDRHFRLISSESYEEDTESDTEEEEEEEGERRKRRKKEEGGRDTEGEVWE